MSVVQEAVTWSADQGEVVDVGLSFGGRVEGHKVVGLAVLVVGSAQHTRMISCEEREPLSWRRRALGSAQ